MDTTEKLLNFVEEPEIFNTKYFPNQEAPIISLAGSNISKRESGDVSNIPVRYNFSSFDFPNIASLFGINLTEAGDFNNNTSVIMDYDREPKIDTWGKNEMVNFDSEHTLIISVDNSFDIYNPNGEDRDENDARYNENANFKYNPKTLAFCFIDHHLYERNVGKCPYHSNASMIYENFFIILKILDKIIRTKQVNNIGVLFHTDLDGIGSGLLIAKILWLIKNNKVENCSNEDRDSAKLAMVLGEYGDISPDKATVLWDLFNSELRKNIFPGIKKKFEVMTKNLGRYMKAIRPVIDVKAHIRSPIVIAELKDKYNELLYSYDIGYDEILDAYLKIKEYFNALRNVDDFTIMAFISKLVQDPVNRLIINMVQKEIDNIVDSYLRPETPQFDFTIQFCLGDNRWPEYRMILIDSPLDIGRSVMWTYKGRLPYFKDAADPKKFNMANYKSIIPTMTKECTNICAYNIFSGKLSLHSDYNQSAFEIGKALGGGGHGGADNGSLGSVNIDFDTLKTHIKIMNMI